MTLLVRRTCPRYDRRVTGEFGRALRAALEREPGATDVQVRGVACLGGCPEDGVVAVDGPGKARVRFTRVTEADAEAVVRAAIAHGASATGVPAEWAVPSELAGRIGTVTAARGPVA